MLKSRGLLAAAMLWSAALTLPAAGLAQPSLFEVERVQLMSAGGEALVRISGEGSLVWSRVRVVDGIIAVVIPDADVRSGLSAEGSHPLIAEVEVAAAPAGRRPAVMVAVRPSASVQHVLDVENGELLLRLTRAEEVARIVPPPGPEPAAIPRVELQPEPPEPEATAETALPDADVEAAQPEAAAVPRADPPAPISEPSADPPAVAPPSASPLPDGSRLSFAEVLVIGETIGSAASPYLGPAPQGQVATSFDGVGAREIEGRSAVLLRGNGEFNYTSFFLPEPDRFVIDLDGVVKRGAGTTTAPLQGVALVRQVRVGQFQQEPAPITRVVFDLEGRGKVRMLPSAEGLYLFFEAP